MNKTVIENQLESIRQKFGQLPEDEKQKLKEIYLSRKRTETPKPGISNVKFSLFFFSDNGSQSNGNMYQLLIDCCKFADEKGFHAVWTPERHFNEFGGPYPNPSVLAAAMAMVSKNIQLRAGSVVLPLHHPVRVAEEWSVVDNLSNGRVGLALASGWHPHDFIFSHHSYEERKTVYKRSILELRRLWNSKKVTYPLRGYKDVDIEIFPKAISKELPLWTTSAGNPATWLEAAKLKTHVLTGLMEQSIEELKGKIDLYREKFKAQGENPQKGLVTVMLHTFLGKNNSDVEKKVKKPLKAYLKNHLKMFEKNLRTQTDSIGFDIDSITEADKETLLEMGFQKYFHQNALMGDLDKGYAMVEKLVSAGVNEVACLVNFGAGDEDIIESLHYLNDLKNRCRKKGFKDV